MENALAGLGDCTRLVNTSSIEPRAYQINIIRSVFTGRNTLVILPTGLGKTLIAVFAIANVVRSGKKAAILAPTKPLSEQHYASLSSLLNIDPGRILLLTGSVGSGKRAEAARNAMVIAATPQTISNDIKAGRISMQDFGLVVFDECHRAVGRYAYTHVAEECKLNGVQVMGLTASPGSTKDKIDKLVAALGIESIEIRITSDQDVQPYVFGKSIETIMVDKGPDIDAVLAKLKPVIDEHLHKLYSLGLSPFTEFDRMPKARLLEIGNTIGKIKAANYKFGALFNYTYVLNLAHAYDLAATEGLYPFISYVQSLRDRDKRSRGVESILKNEDVLEAERLAKEALAAGREHPKMSSLLELVRRMPAGKSIIVFAQYRATIKKIVDVLKSNDISARGFMGKKDGVTNASQQQTIQDFRDRKFSVLVATSIAEEGLDIPSVDAAIFYEPVASEIRNIQRRGRAGRMSFGTIAILVTKGTRDETYNLVARLKEKRMRDIVAKIQQQLRSGAYAREGPGDAGQMKLGSL